MNQVVRQVNRDQPNVLVCRSRLNGSVTNTLSIMTVRRRERGSLVEPRKVAFTIEAEADDRITESATKLGITRSAYIQWLAEHVQRDAAGLPVGWPEDSSRNGELPIDSR